MIVGAIGPAYKGSKKHPAETGGITPPSDLTPYILTELRELNRKHDTGTRQLGSRLDQIDRKQDENCRKIDERHDQQDGLLGRIYTDTQLIPDRGSR